MDEIKRMQELAGIQEIKVVTPNEPLFYVYDVEGMEEPIGPFTLEQANNERRRLGVADYDIMDEKTAREVYELNEIKIDPHKFRGTEQEALAFLGKFVPYPELYKDNYITWETAMFSKYNELDDFTLEDIVLPKQEFDVVHDALVDDDYAYFVRNFTTGDEEETRHEDDIDQSLEYFEERYNVDREQAIAMKFLVDDILKPSLQ